jgi:hypothetical protein
VRSDPVEVKLAGAFPNRWWKAENFADAEAAQTPSGVPPPTVQGRGAALNAIVREIVHTRT